MLFMVIEHFKDVRAIGERFARKGRMLPDGVAYHASWVQPGGARCFQVMEADGVEPIEAWASGGRTSPTSRSCPCSPRSSSGRSTALGREKEKTGPEKPDRSSL